MPGPCTWYWNTPIAYLHSASIKTLNKFFFSSTGSKILYDRCIRWRLGTYSVLLLVLAWLVKLFSISTTTEFNLSRISTNKLDSGHFSLMDPFFHENMIYFGHYFFAKLNFKGLIRFSGKIVGKHLIIALWKLKNELYFFSELYIIKTMKTFTYPNLKRERREFFKH